MKPNVNFYCLNGVVCLCYIVLYVGTMQNCFFVFNRELLFDRTVLYYEAYSESKDRFAVKKIK